jgi:hypothetical protein
MFSFSGHFIDYDFTSESWISARAPVTATAHGNTSAARNLCELFVHELAQLVVGACQAERAAQVVADRVNGQAELHRLVLRLAKSSRACLPSLPNALREEGLTLPRAHDAALDALLMLIDPEDYAISFEPVDVTATRIVNALWRITIHLNAQAIQAAEHAFLLGSDQLHGVLTNWASIWQNYNAELRSCAIRFHAQAYAA